MSRGKSKGNRRVKLGDVFQIALPNGRYAYGRVYRLCGVGIYRRTSSEPNRPPIGSRDFLFHVAMYRAALTTGECAVVGCDPFLEGEDEYQPAQFIRDEISGGYEIYHKGETRPATEEECRSLEPAAVWDLNHIIDRILHGKKSKYLRSLYL